MVNVDTVYQRVLALANKEQRGYITPQEFNLFANQAQMDLFEQYFYDLNQFLRVPSNDTAYANMVNILQEKIELFQKSNSYNTTAAATSYGAVSENTINLPSDYYRIAQVTTENYNGGIVEVEKVSKKQCDQAKTAPLTSPTLSRPQYYQLNSKIFINPTSIQSVNISYIHKPEKVNWTYVVVGGKALLNNNDANYQDFELHPSKETDLVIKILQLAGLSLKDPGLIQVAAAEETKSIQQEKQ